MRNLLAAIAVLLLAGAAWAAFTPLTVTWGDSISCGSWAVRDHEKAERADYVDRLAGSTVDGESAAKLCDQAVSDRMPIVLVLGALGIGAGIAAAAMRSREEPRQPTPPPHTVQDPQL